MAAGTAIGIENQDSLASLERLKQVETDGDAQVRMIRGKIDLTLSQLHADSETQIKAAQQQANEEADALLVRTQKEADAESARILAEAKAALAQRAKAGPPDLGKAWPDILDVLLGEFS
jgi:F0F1-type ATP synthase membrane subunit b/b'